jgi:hypothetical protein
MIYTDLITNRYVIIDVSFITTFYEAEKIDDYWELMKFFSRFDKQYYVDHNIYTETHHMYPKFELGGIALPLTVELPVLFHFRAHILRARSHTDKKLNWFNYCAANFVISRSPRRLSRKQLDFIYDVFPLEVYEAKNAHLAQAKEHIIEYNRLFRGKTYEDRYGKERALEIKKKLGEKTHVKNLNESETTRRKRQKSVKEYASKRPQSHNDAISRGKTGKPSGRDRKRLIHLNTMKVYDNLTEAVKNTGQNYNSIRSCCDSGSHCKGHFWSYYEEGIDYSKMLDTLKDKCQILRKSLYTNGEYLELLRFKGLL